MPTFVNHNRHRVYVQDPEKGLVKVLAGDEVDATGAFADNLENTNGVYKKGTDEEKAKRKQREGQEQQLQNFGPKAFPAEEPEYETDGKSVKPEDIVGDEDAPDQGGGGTVTTDDLPSSGEKKPARRRASKSSSRKSS